MHLILDVFEMISGIKEKSLVVWLWGGLLNIPQFIGGLYFITVIEGLAVLIFLVATLVIAGQIHKRTPFSRRIVFCHIPWLALMPWIVYRLIILEHPTALSFWLYYVSAAICISLVFEVFEAYRLARGDETFAWAK